MRIAVTMVIAATAAITGAASGAITIPMRRGLGNARRRLGATRAERESDGLFFARLEVGTPPQLFDVLVDTGSSTIAVPCARCRTCGDHASFDASASSTARVLDESYSQCYAEGSCNAGSVVRDVACLGASCETRKFGCCDVYAPAFRDQRADGIVGVSGGPDAIHDGVVALCFGAQSGWISLGEVPPETLLEPLQWTDRDVASIDVGELALPIRLKAFVDSGSSVSLVPRRVRAELRAMFADFDLVDGDPDSVACSRSTLPIVGLNLAGARLTIDPIPYRDVWCVGLFADDVAEVIIGASSMIGRVVVFDRSTTKVGFARAVCD